MRLADQVRAIEEQTRPAGIGIVGQVAVRADDGVLSAGDGLHNGLEIEHNRLC